MDLLQFSSVTQWWIYIEAKEAVLGAPGLKGLPKLKIE